MEALTELDYIEICVGNALQASHFYRTALGFRQVGYLGPETGARDQVAYQLCQGDITLVIRASLGAEGIADHVRRHGDSVRDVALRTVDVEGTFARAMAFGASEVPGRTPIADVPGRRRIGVFGDVRHSLRPISYRARGGGGLLPGFRHRPLEGASAGLIQVDHVVGNVAKGDMRNWREFYKTVFDAGHIQRFRQDDVATEKTSLQSDVLRLGEGNLILNVNEPRDGLLRSHIQEYLDAHAGPGIQHIALLTRCAVDSVHKLRSNGANFIEVAESYFSGLEDAIAECPHSIRATAADLSREQLLLDWDEHGYLLQTFTDIVQDRPTLFYEIIERNEARTFGLRTFNTLFRAMEAAQLRRRYT